MKSSRRLLIFLPLLLAITIFTGSADKEVFFSVIPFNYSQYSLYLENGNDDLILRVESFDPGSYMMALDDLQESYPTEFKIENQTLRALQECRSKGLIWSKE
jgi:hypothetical protein